MKIASLSTFPPFISIVANVGNTRGRDVFAYKTIIVGKEISKILRICLFNSSFHNFMKIKMYIVCTDTIFLF